MSTSKWDPRQYDRFRSERQQPFDDLIGLIEPRPGMRIVDLGCGTGELTLRLHERLRAAETVGVDNSDTMLARAQAVRRPGLTWVHADLSDIDVAGFDLIFSNAALQWVSGHARLIQRFADSLPPAGQLAIQMPANFDHPSHRVAATLAATEPFATALGGYTRSPGVLLLEEYATLLHRCGFADQHTRLQIYGHVLTGPEEVVEWTRGTLLVAYQERLPEALFAQFVDTYRRHLLAQLATHRPYFYAFKRLLLWARR